MDISKKFVLAACAGALIAHNACAMQEKENRLKRKSDNTGGNQQKKETPDDKIFVPEEVIQNILSFAINDGKNFLNYMVVCKLWNNVTKNNYESFVASIVQLNSNRFNTILLRTQDERVIRSIIKTFGPNPITTMIAQTNTELETPLTLALKNHAGDESCKLLIENGVEISNANRSAIRKQLFFKAVVALVKRDINRREDYYGEIITHEIITHKLQDSFRWLIATFSTFKDTEKQLTLNVLDSIVYRIKSQQALSSSLCDAIFDGSTNETNRFQTSYFFVLNKILSYAIKYKKLDLTYMLAQSGFTVPENHENYDQLPLYIKILLTKTRDEQSYCSIQ